MNVPDEYNFLNMEELRDYIKKLEKTQCLDEGFVCWNQYTGFRVKIKSP